MKRVFFPLMMVAFLVGFVAMSQAQELTSLDEVNQSEFAKDFQWQGEYITPEDGRAYQVIADGNGKFRIVGYPGGLPGEGWDRTMARFFGTGTLDSDNKMTIIGEKMIMPKRENPELIFDEKQKSRPMSLSKQEDGKFVFVNKVERAAEKVVRESPTLGMEPPKGAFVVFNGKDLNNFKPGAKMNEATGTLWAEACSVPFENKPYLLHLEFMTSFMPTKQGQARSNSGVYIAECYECQVLDSFGLEGLNNECGGFYQSNAPNVNMAFSPLTWQTYDIELTPAKFEDGKKVAEAKVTVLHNGVLIHDNLTLPKDTPGRLKEVNEPRGVYLQGHGNKVQYRNIWVLYK